MERLIGIHLSFWQTAWTDDLRPLVGKAFQAGFNVAEFPLLFPQQLDFPSLRDELQKYGMHASCSTGLGIETDVTSPDKQVRQAGIGFIRQCILAARQLGSPVLVGVTYAPWGFFPTSDMAERRNYFLSSLKETTKIAEDNDITLCIEVINRYEGYLLNTVQQGLAVIEAVDSPNLKLHLDTYHMNIEESSITEAIRSAGTAMGHLHCSENNRRRPGGGHIPWKEIAKVLNDIRYNGFIVTETFINPAGEVGRGLFIWDSSTPTLDETASQAASFLKNVFIAD